MCWCELCWFCKRWETTFCHCAHFRTTSTKYYILNWNELRTCTLDAFFLFIPVHTRHTRFLYRFVLRTTSCTPPHNYRGQWFLIRPTIIFSLLQPVKQQWSKPHLLWIPSFFSILFVWWRPAWQLHPPPKKTLIQRPHDYLHKPVRQFSLPPNHEGQLASLCFVHGILPVPFWTLCLCFLGFQPNSNLLVMSLPLWLMHNVVLQRGHSHLSVRPIANRRKNCGEVSFY